MRCSGPLGGDLDHVPVPQLREDALDEGLGADDRDSFAREREHHVEVEVLLV